MLRTETVEKGTLDLMCKLMADEKFASFNLVGATALALKIGHRKSIDIDLFTDMDFDSTDFAEYLTKNYNATHIKSITNGVFCFVNDIKLDLLTHKYPLWGKIEVDEGIRLISLKDIGVMKLNAIYDNGTRLKDFIDLYYLLETFLLGELLHGSEHKYPNTTIDLIKLSLMYHDDIDLNVQIDYTAKS